MKWRSLVLLALTVALLLGGCSADDLMEQGAALLDQVFAGDSEPRMTVGQAPGAKEPEPEPEEPSSPAEPIEPAEPTEPTVPSASDEAPPAVQEPAQEPTLPEQAPAVEVTPSYTDATFFGPGESFLYVPQGVSGVYACTYASEDESVAAVDANTGRVTAVGPGTTKVTMHVEYNGQYDFECIVRCSWDAEPSLPTEPEQKPASNTKPEQTTEPSEPAITASHTDATFFGPRERFRLTPVGAGDDVSCTYTTADPDIASVDINGNVTAIGPGTTTITMTVDGGGTDYIFKCIVRCKWSEETE